MKSTCLKCWCTELYSQTLLDLLMNSVSTWAHCSCFKYSQTSIRQRLFQIKASPKPEQGPKEKVWLIQNHYHLDKIRKKEKSVVMLQYLKVTQNCNINIRELKRLVIRIFLQQDFSLQFIDMKPQCQFQFVPDHFSRHITTAVVFKICFIQLQALGNTTHWTISQFLLSKNMLIKRA